MSDTSLKPGLNSSSTAKADLFFIECTLLVNNPHQQKIRKFIPKAKFKQFPASLILALGGAG